MPFICVCVFLWLYYIILIIRKRNYAKPCRYITYCTHTHTHTYIFLKLYLSSLKGKSHSRPYIDCIIFLRAFSGIVQLKRVPTPAQHKKRTKGAVAGKKKYPENVLFFFVDFSFFLLETSILV